MSNVFESARPAEMQGLDAQLYALYRSGILGIIRVDAERILDANDTFLAMVGYSREEMKAGLLDWREMTPPEYRELDDRALQELYDTGSCTPFEKEYIRKDGTRVPIFLAATQLRADPIEWAVYVLDLSARRRAATADRTLATIIERVPVGIIVVDQAGKLILMNEVGRQISGAPPSESAAVADQAADYVLREPGTGRPLRPEETPIGRAVAGETVEPYEYTFRPLGAHIDTWVRCVAAPLRDEQGRGIGAVAVFEDVTAERARERARSDFLSAAAHDLKGPLTSIKGFSQLLLRRFQRTDILQREEAEPHLQRIEQTTTRMQTLINELLDIARLQSGETLDLMRRPADLVEIVGEAVGQYAGATGDHFYRVETDEAALVGEWDAARIERVVGNLCANAATYSPDGGEITISIGRQSEDGVTWAVLSVQDRGIGIPARDLPHIFDRFYRGSNAMEEFSGTGIGLAGVKQIVEQHGGTVEADSTEGEGSTFTVRLPLAPPV